ncbi:MAG: hypothetical protein K6G27_02610 [Lachnospiraceae bacterium]|nr:hypothetical protein [Lachnospiraceae bacterium]
MIAVTRDDGQDVSAMGLTYINHSEADSRVISIGYWFCRLFPGFGLICVCMIKDSLLLPVSSEDPPKEIQIREENSRKAEAYEG